MRHWEPSHYHRRLLYQFEKHLAAGSLCVELLGVCARVLGRRPQTQSTLSRLMRACAEEEQAQEGSALDESAARNKSKPFPLHLPAAGAVIKASSAV